MKVLLLHPEDGLPGSDLRGQYDLIVDLGRAPLSTYERWGQQAGCRVISLFDFADGFEDVYRVRDLLCLGMGYIVDEWGVDWWDVLSLLIEPDLLKTLLMERLAKELKDCKLYSSRNDGWVEGLHSLTGGELKVLKRLAVLQRIRHYREVFGELNVRQISQVIEDKFDGQHRLRRHIAKQRRSSRTPVVLLPSAYINVSRTASAYASLLPDQKFLLVYSRSSGKLRNTPANVEMVSFDRYCTAMNDNGFNSLHKRWTILRSHLVSIASEFRLTNAAGVFSRIPSLLRWGIALRNGWNLVFDSENVVACLSADDTNPHTRIPIILAKHRGIPTVACHHGALDYRMALKKNHADSYLVKDAMEREYLSRMCRLSPRTMIEGNARYIENAKIGQSSVEPCLTYFSEPYQTDGWRVDEVYRDLLPRLWKLSQSCGLKLVLKLHPFESRKAHTKYLRRHLRDHLNEVTIVSGTVPVELWQRTHIALTVESTIALDCAARGIPVFFCAWLGTPHSGYIDQFAKFGVGEVLQSADDLDDVRNFLVSHKRARRGPQRREIDRETLRNILYGRKLAVAAG